MRRNLIVLCLFYSIAVSAQPQWQQAEALEKLNSSSDDYAPCWNPFNNTLLFTSERSGRARLFCADSSFSVVGDFTLFNQSKGKAYAFSSMSKSGVFLCSVYRHGERQAIATIASSRLINSVWSELELENSVLSDSFSSHPTISPSGSTIVFVSDREGGQGGTDLWLCTRSGSIWGTPVNLGEELNSEADEVTPFLCSDDTLYFSSNGFGGRGGQDVFMTTLVAGEWQPPLPLKSINTSFDETDFIVLPNQRAVFASNRNGLRTDVDLFSAACQITK